MAEINLGKVRGDEVTKQSITSALGFPVKEIVIISQSEYDVLLPHEQEGERLFFIKDISGKILYKDEQIWDLTFPVLPKWDGTFADPLAGQILFDAGLIANATKSSEEELAEITSIDGLFESNEDITAFDELQYFTGLTSLGNYCFDGCSSLTSIIIPDSVTSLGDMCFINCSSLTSITIPDSVTSLVGYCFANCSSLTTIIIPDSVTSLKSGSFRGCSSLPSVTIPDSVTSLENSCFESCTSLTSIIIPDSVVSLGGGCFYDCSNLTSVTLESITPPTITSVTFDSTVQKFYVPAGSVQAYKTASEWSDFANKIFPMNAIVFEDPEVARVLYAAGLIENSTWSSEEELALITYEDLFVDSLNSIFSENETITSFKEFKYFTGLTRVQDRCFKDCIALKEIIVPPNVTELQFLSFSGCDALSSIVLPKDLKTLGISAFINTVSLKEISIPDTVTKIENSCFSMSGIENLIIPNTVTELGRQIFYFSKIKTITYPASIETASYEIFGRTFDLSLVTVAEGVTTFGEDCFVGSGIREITLPSTFSVIPQGCFSECYQLDAVTILNPIPPVVGAYALPTPGPSIYVPAESVSAYKAATGWSSLADYIYPIGVVGIQDPEVGRILHTAGLISNAAYSTKEELQLITKEDLISGENSIFTGNETITKFKELRYCTELLELPERLLSGCSNLIFVSIPHTVKILRDSCFSSCEKLSNLTLPKDLKTIESSVFKGTTKLTELVIPHGVTTLGGTCFSFSGIEELIIPNSVTTLGEGFCQSATVLDYFTYPASITSIGANAFAQTGIYTARIEEGVKELGVSMFEGSGINEITLPSSVELIPESCFANCSQLTRIEIKALIPPVVGANAFPTPGTSIYVPAESVSAYKAATNWSAFADKIFPIK